MILTFPIIVKDVKDPNNYFRYIKGTSGFLDTLRQEYDIAYDLKDEIKKLQKKLKSAHLRLNSIAKNLNDSASHNSDDGISEPKTIVLEPMGIIFTIQTEEIEGVTPNLVFELKDAEGKVQTNYLYLNQSFKPFLLYL